MSERLVLIIQGICQAAARRGARDRVNAPLLLLAWGRLNRMARRFEALVALVRAGQLPRQTHAGPRLRPPAMIAPSRPQHLPGGFAWLVRLAPETAAYGSQLRHLLDDPETGALLAAAPQAGRILRPLCRMLGVPAGPGLILPARRSAPDQPARHQPQAPLSEAPCSAGPPPDREPPCHEPPCRELQVARST